MANRRISLHSQDPLPVGFRFSPTEEELLDHYLKNKVFGNESLVEYIPQIDVYDFEPWDIPRLLSDHTGVEKLFFFSALDVKNSNGKRTSRVTKAGFWKSTGNDRKIRAGGTNQLIGTKKTLVYHRGRVPNANRTNWVIHQYSLYTDTPSQNLRSLVVCRLKKKSDMNVAQFDGPNDLDAFENVITMKGIQVSSAISNCTGQPALPDSQSINASDYGVNWQSTQPELYFDPDEFLYPLNSSQQPSLPDFQPHPMASNSYFEDDLMDFHPTNGINSEVNNQLVQLGASESENDLAEYLNSLLENENDNEVTSRICIDSYAYDREEPSNRPLGFHDEFRRGTDNVADFWCQSNGIPPSRSYKCVGSATKTKKCFQSKEEKEIYLHKALQGSSSGSIVSTQNVFSYIVTTKHIQHKSAHPLFYIAKAFLGIILFVVLALKLLLHSN